MAESNKKLNWIFRNKHKIQQLNHDFFQPIKNILDLNHYYFFSYGIESDFPKTFSMTKRYTFRQFSFFLTISILLISLLTSCASKRYMNKALELEEAGLITEAADLYLRSLQANDDNVDSKLGLKRTGQVVLDKKSEAFMAYYRNHQNKEAVYAYLDAQKYHDLVKRFGIDLRFSENIPAYYGEVKDIYLNDQYGKAINALNVENFDNALTLLNEIIKIDNNYRDAGKLWVTAKYEPIYRKGLNDLKSEKNRSAYYTFNEILTKNGPYKEASKLRTEAREKALIRIGIIPFSSLSLSQKNIADEMRTYITADISRQKSPFYEVIESQALKNLNNNNYSLLASLLLKNQERAPQIPRNLDAILTGKINHYSASTTPLTKTKRKAWLREINKVKHEDGTEEEVTEYKKVYYYEYSRRSLFNISISYALTNTHTKAVMVSDMIEKKLEDQISFAKFNGDHRKLVPGTWYSLTKKSIVDKVFDNSESVKELQAKFGRREELKDSYKLKKQALGEASEIIAQKIVNYNPEL